MPCAINVCCMKHLTYSDRSVLVGDEAADAITQYAATLARHNSADAVVLNVLDSFGDEVEATFLLNVSAVLFAEGTHSVLPEPDNAQAVVEMRHQIQALDDSGNGQSRNERFPDRCIDLDL